MTVQSLNEGISKLHNAIWDIEEGEEYCISVQFAFQTDPVSGRKECDSITLDGCAELVLPVLKDVLHSKKKELVKLLREEADKIEKGLF